MTDARIAPAPPALNVQLAAFALAAAATIGGWIFVGGALAQRVAAVEQTVEPIRQGDLRALQTDVAWIRRHLEQERAP